VEISDQKIVILDGACGTSIQGFELNPSAWDGHEGCNEYLNLSSPETIISIHESFLDAGAMVIETNSFGANSVVLSEYGLEDKTAEINRTAVENARKAIGKRKGRYVAGSVGPTTKLPSLGHITVEELERSLVEQMRALLESGVDCLVLETCQDILQGRTGVIAALDLMEEMKIEVPLMVSVTIEQGGTMLVGTDIAAVVANFDPFPLFSLGLNCATGPRDMVSHIRYLRDQWPGRISCVPNAGIPEIVGGETKYPLSPDSFASQLAEFVAKEGVSVVGGCCGTTPSHIMALADALAKVEPAHREVER